MLFSLASHDFLVYCNVDCSVLSKINEVSDWFGASFKTR